MNRPRDNTEPPSSSWSLVTDEPRCDTRKATPLNHHRPERHIRPSLPLPRPWHLRPEPFPLSVPFDSTGTRYVGRRAFGPRERWIYKGPRTGQDFGDSYGLTRDLPSTCLTLSTSDYIRSPSPLPQAPTALMILESTRYQSRIG